MNWFAAAVSDFRSERKCFSISGSLLLLLLLSAAQTSALRHMNTELHSADVSNAAAAPAEYANAKNVEWQHVKSFEQQQQHPVVMYKEDFVNEDFVPAKNASHKSTSNKNYKDIAQTRRELAAKEPAEQYRALQPEKIYFDVLPQAPLVIADDSAANDSKFDPKKIRVEVMSLADNTEYEENSKQALSKHPKKYQHRVRRDTNDEHIVQKRNPYYRQQQHLDNNVNDFFKLYYYQNPANTYAQNYKKHPVQGKLWNSLHLTVAAPTKAPPPVMSFENRFGAPEENNRVVWGGRKPATTTRPVSNAQQGRRPPPPLFHDSNPENADFSFFAKSPAEATTNASPTSQRRGSSSTPARLEPEQSANGDEIVSECVWAIVSCCRRRDIKIRYHCFEEYGCSGAFWDLNPCADKIRDSAINYVDAIFS